MLLHRYFPIRDLKNFSAFHGSFHLQWGETEAREMMVLLGIKEVAAEDQKQEDKWRKKRLGLTS